MARAALVCAVALTLAWAGFRLRRRREQETRRQVGVALIAVAMIVAFVVPPASAVPEILWWLPPAATAAFVLARAWKKKSRTSSRLRFAGWMLLTAAGIEILFGVVPRTLHLE